jgi:hypothetical protein
MTDTPNQDEIKKEDDKKEEVVATPTDLEAEHAKAQRLLEEEELKANDEDEEEQDSDDEELKANDEDEEEQDSDDEEEVKPKEDIKADDTPPAPQKISVKDSDGKTHEFASLDEVPDDFEPETYKSWGIFVADMAVLEKNRQDDLKSVEELNAKTEREASIKAMQDGWDKEIAELKIEKDKADKVFALMGEELEAGRRIDSFTHAYEIYEYRHREDEVEKKKQEEVVAKKKAGSKVMGSGSGVATDPKTQGRTIEAPPRGVSLDDVHAKVLGSL